MIGQEKVVCTFYHGGDKLLIKYGSIYTKVVLKTRCPRVKSDRGDNEMSLSKKKQGMVGKRSISKVGK